MRRIIDKAVYTTSSTQPTHIDGIYIYNVAQNLRSLTNEKCTHTHKYIQKYTIMLNLR